jgi:hypothetical protein
MRYGDREGEEDEPCNCMCHEFHDDDWQWSGLDAEHAEGELK